MAQTPGSEVRHPDALGNDLWRSEEPDPNEAKTGIHLHEIRLSDEDGYVHRSMAKDDPEVSRASIITMPAGTVFALESAQWLALERLWGTAARYGDATSPEAASEGERTLRAHRRRERSSILRDRKLAEVRAAYGRCICAICGMDELTMYPRKFAGRIFEVHHLAPLSKAATPVRTTLADLAVLCANCHRAVHASSAVEANYFELCGLLSR